MADRYLSLRVNIDEGQDRAKRRTAATTLTVICLALIAAALWTHLDWADDAAWLTGFLATAYGIEIELTSSR